MTVVWDVFRVVLEISIDVSDVITATIMALMMAIVSTSKTSIDFHQTTRRNIPNFRHFHIHRLDYLKFYYGHGLRLETSSN